MAESVDIMRLFLEEDEVGRSGAVVQRKLKDLLGCLPDDLLSPYTGAYYCASLNQKGTKCSDLPSPHFADKSLPDALRDLSACGLHEFSYEFFIPHAHSGYLRTERYPSKADVSVPTSEDVKDALGLILSSAAQIKNVYRKMKEPTFHFLPVTSLFRFLPKDMGLPDQLLNAMSTADSRSGMLDNDQIVKWIIVFKDKELAIPDAFRDPDRFVDPLCVDSDTEKLMSDLIAGLNEANIKEKYEKMGISGVALEQMFLLSVYYNATSWRSNRNNFMLLPTPKLKP